MTVEEAKIVLDIKGTFEVAIARNSLRKAASAYRLPLSLQARASAVITNIAELILFQSESHNRQLKLVIFIYHETAFQGIEFQFFAVLRNDIMKRIPSAEWQLDSICDEFELSQHGSFDHITMRLFARKEES